VLRSYPPKSFNDERLTRKRLWRTGRGATEYNEPGVFEETTPELTQNVRLLSFECESG
jgi:hypothetical protein